MQCGPGFLMHYETDQPDGAIPASGGDVDVLIVNYKTPCLTAEAARSVVNDPLVRCVLIVDNASGDGSAEHLSRELAPFGDRIQIVESDTNLGFGGGNNLAARAAEGKYLFLLNSDAVAHPGCIALLRDVLERDTSIGIAAPSVILSETGELQPGTHGVFPTPSTLLMRKTTASPADDLSPDWVSGVAFLARRSEIALLGGFDESLFMYYEDVDLCRRYRLRGLSTAREPRASVVHKLGQSGIGNPRHKSVYYQSQDRYLELAGYPRRTLLALAAARTAFNAPRALAAWRSRMRGDL